MKFTIVELEMLFEACRNEAHDGKTVPKAKTEYMKIMARLENKMQRKLDAVKE